MFKRRFIFNNLLNYSAGLTRSFPGECIEVCIMCEKSNSSWDKHFQLLSHYPYFVIKPQCWCLDFMEQNSGGTSLLMSTNSVVFWNLHICSQWVFEIIKRKIQTCYMQSQSCCMYPLVTESMPVPPNGIWSDSSRPQSVPWSEAHGPGLEWSRLQLQAACSKLIFGWNPLGPAVRCLLAKDRRAVNA